MPFPEFTLVDDLSFPFLVNKLTEQAGLTDSARGPAHTPPIDLASEKKKKTPHAMCPRQHGITELWRGCYETNYNQIIVLLSCRRFARGLRSSNGCRFRQNTRDRLRRRLD